ncbi:MAG TPA: TolC family protein, partial [Sphingomonadaceae bacterium]|nr:TolC family protein [Sphingomonadaceae bacterium]
MLNGCAFEAPQESLNIHSPQSWEAVSSGGNGKISSGWLSTFGDRELKRVVHRALEHNQSLKAAAARLREAKEQSIISRARQLPELDLGTRGSVSEGSGFSRRQSYDLNLAASWEPDLWGRLRDLSSAASAEER